MTSEAQQIRDWYKLVKQNSTCLCDKREGLPAQYGKVEFHHMNASSKRDTLSSMAIKPLIPCLTYHIEPVTFAVELMKVIPLSVENHKQLHRADDRGDVRLLQERFDFDRDAVYRSEIKTFRSMALDLASKTVLNKVHEGLYDLMETGKIVFSQSAGFALV